MAKVVIQRTWPDSDDLCVVVEVDESYPQALHDAKRACLDGYAEALAITVAPVADEEVGE